MSDLYTDKENFLVVLDSRNATTLQNGSYNSSIYFDFNEPIRMPKNCLKMMCSVLHFQAPNSIYNINENNNILYITMNSIKTTYILQKGLYNCNNFMTYLLSILPSSFSISINTITNKFTFINTTYEFIISGNCAQILGFSLSSSASSSSNALHVAYNHLIFI